MFDWRWIAMRGLLWALQKIGKRDGKFVFAAGCPEVERARLAVAVADMTAIPAGQPVRDITDVIVNAHKEAVVRAFFARVAPGGMPEALMEALRMDPNLPERSWKTDDVGQA